MPPKVDISPETLASQEKLTPEQEDALDEQIMKELSENKEAPEYNPDEDEDVKQARADEEKENGEKKVVEPEEKEEEEEKVEEEQEEKAEEKEEAETEKKEEAPDLEALAKEYAGKLKITVEDAKKDLESIGRIREKYANDPFEMSKAILYSQRMASRFQQQVRDKQADSLNPYEWQEDKCVVTQEDGNKKEFTKEQIVEMFREKYPKRTERIDDDDVVYQMAKDDQAVYFNSRKEILLRDLKEKATERRKELLAQVPEQNKKYMEEINGIVEQFSDVYVVQPNFTIDDAVNVVLGKHYHDDIASARKEGYQKGLEKAKILEDKKAPTGKAPSSKQTTLTPAEQEEALLMFEEDPISKEEKFKLYKDFKNGGKK